MEYVHTYKNDLTCEGLRLQASLDCLIILFFLVNWLLHSVRASFVSFEITVSVSRLLNDKFKKQNLLN